MPLINGIGIILNCAVVGTLAFTHDEQLFGWSVVAVTVAYLCAIAAFMITARLGLYVHLLLWPSMAQNIFAIVVLGGIVWSGGQLFWGIILAIAAALFLGKRVAVIVAWSYVAIALVLGLLEPTLRELRSQPALGLSTGLAVDVFVVSVALLVPVVVGLVDQINAERDRSERLLLNVLPRIIADRLKREPGVIADAYASCTVLFADLVGFTDHSLRVSPERLIEELNEVFSRFDALVAACGAEKIKTMGDGYLAVAGAPDERSDHAAVICELALQLQESLPKINRDLGTAFELRIGIDTGPLIAGVVGKSRFSYDLWGQTVNLASRMQTLCPPGMVLVTDPVSRVAGPDFVFDRHTMTEVKGVGQVATCVLVGRAEESANPRGRSAREHRET